MTHGLLGILVKEIKHYISLLGVFKVNTTFDFCQNDLS